MATIHHQFLHQAPKRMRGDLHVSCDEDDTVDDSPSSVQSLTPNSPASRSDCSSASTSTDAVSPSGVDSNDLPDQLLAEGWRKCYSLRQRRIYYFNEGTKVSLWDMPKGTDGATVLSPVSRLDCDDRNGAPPVECELISPPLTVSQQKPSSSKDAKQFVASNDWFINGVTNVQIPERVHFEFIPPHPKVESNRFEQLCALKQQFRHLLLKHDVCEPCDDTYICFLMERATWSKGLEPTLCVERAPELCKCLQQRMLCNVPVRFRDITAPAFEQSVNDMKKILSRYIMAAKRMADYHEINAADRKLIKWRCTEVEGHLQKLRGNDIQTELKTLMSNLHTQLGPLLFPLASPVIASLCKQVHRDAVQKAAELRQMHKEFFENSCGIMISETVQVEPKNKVVFSYQAIMRHIGPRMPTTLRHHQDRRFNISISYGNDSFVLGGAHFFKLEQLYRRNAVDDGKFASFLGRIWCLLKRYWIICDPVTHEGVHFQESLSAAVMRCLTEEFRVTFECFASPFNCYFGHYCSLYADTDGYFGSSGSFFDFSPLAGSFVAFPPDCAVVTERCVVKINDLLEASNMPMSFVLVLQCPLKSTVHADVLKFCHNSKMKVDVVSIQPDEYRLKHGLQHLPDYYDKKIQLFDCALEVFILQNDAGRKKWPSSMEKMNLLRSAFLQK